MWKKRLTTGLACLSLIGALSGAVQAEIVKVWVYSHNGKIKKTEVISDGKSEITVKVIWL